ncbi:hypothetical protein [Bacillus weihaiensis]|uniref:hypothetical protein n=1 Tax=Bacillus weihaiensis TaxID=1547283 RepID=UPI00235647E1|nr:hypothetical protein [Bacillus weihaiensis]
MENQTVTFNAFREVSRVGEYTYLPSAYFRKLEKLIGDEELKQNENVVIVIWAEDIPVKILVVINGELVETDASKKFPSLNIFQLLDLIENGINNNGGKIYDVLVKGKEFIFYDEQ